MLKRLKKFQIFINFPQLDRNKKSKSDKDNLSLLGALLLVEGFYTLPFARDLIKILYIPLPCFDVGN